MTTTTAPLAPGRAVPYATALGMSGTVGRLIRVSVRSVPGDVFASIAVPVHRTPGAWVKADAVPVQCGARCALYAAKRGAVVVFAYLHDHDGDRPPAEQRRGDMDAPDGPPRPQGTRVLSWGRRQYTWTTARDVSPILGGRDSERMPETEDEGLQVATMHDDPELGHGVKGVADHGAGWGEPPTEWVSTHAAPTYSRVAVTKNLHTPKAEHGRKARPCVIDPRPPRS